MAVKKLNTIYQNKCRLLVCICVITAFVLCCLLVPDGKKRLFRGCYLYDSPKLIEGPGWTIPPRVISLTRIGDSLYVYQKPAKYKNVMIDDPDSIYSRGRDTEYLWKISLSDKRLLGPYVNQ